MARARNIKPGFFTNETLAECEPLARLLFIGLWTIADREGRLEDRPKKLKACILPYEECNIVQLLDSLEQTGFIQRYTSDDGRRLVWITKFHTHQKPHHMEEPSQLPPPPEVSNKYNHEPVTKVQRERILSRDNRRCVKCKSENDLHIDHIIPVSRGGTSEDTNLRVLCQTCNLKKGNRDDQEHDMHSTRVDDESMTSREPIEQNGSRRTLTLNPLTDSLNTDCLNPQTLTSAKADKYSPDFETFWSSFPKLRRTAKGRAWRAWKQAVRSTRPETILGAVVEYAASETGRGQFVVMPATWLNGACWQDDRAAWNPSLERRASAVPTDEDNANWSSGG